MLCSFGIPEIVEHEQPPIRRVHQQPRVNNRVRMPDLGLDVRDVPGEPVSSKCRAKRGHSLTREALAIDLDRVVGPGALDIDAIRMRVPESLPRQWRRGIKSAFVAVATG